MTLTATTSPLGFELVRHTHKDEVLYCPGDPGDTITRNDMLAATAGEGILDLLAASETAVAQAMKTVIMSSLATGFPKPRDFDAAHDTSNTLVPVHPLVAEGVPIYKATIAGHWDDLVASYDAATPYIGLTTGCSVDDYPNGAYVYVYAGTGVGQINVVADYTHTGGAAEKMITLHRAFETALSTDSYVVILGGEAAASRGIGCFTRIDGYDNNNLTTADGANDGDFTVYADWRELETYLKNLTLPVIPSSALWLS